MNVYRIMMRRSDRFVMSAVALRVVSMCECVLYAVRWNWRGMHTDVSVCKYESEGRVPSLVVGDLAVDVIVLSLILRLYWHT